MAKKEWLSRNRINRILIIKMRKITIDKVPRLIKLRKKLETKLKVKITNNGKEFSINGSAENEYIAEKILEALDMGFPLSHALLIKNEDNAFEKLKIKDYTKRKDLKSIKARLIGTQGKTLQTISNITDCFIEIKDFDVGIIGHVEDIKNAQDAVISIIQGSKQGNVYSRLERNKPMPLADLGLRDKEQ